MLQTLETEAAMSKKRNGRKLMNWHHSNSVDSWLRDHFPDVDPHPNNCEKLENKVEVKGYHKYNTHIINSKYLQSTIPIF